MEIDCGTYDIPTHVSEQLEKHEIIPVPQRREVLH